MPSRPISARDAYPLIYRVVQKIPRGKVASYAQIASEAGLPGRARMVGRALSDAGATSAAPDLPWHRVINAQGLIALPGSSAGYLEQKARLISEGVEFGRGDRVRFSRFGWKRGRAPIVDD